MEELSPALHRLGNSIVVITILVVVNSTSALGSLGAIEYFQGKQAIRRLIGFLVWLAFILAPGLLGAYFIYGPMAQVDERGRWSSSPLQICLMVGALGALCSVYVLKRSFLVARNIRARERYLLQWVAHDDERDRREKVRALARVACLNTRWSIGLPIYFGSVQVFTVMLGVLPAADPVSPADAAAIFATLAVGAIAAILIPKALSILYPTWSLVQRAMTHYYLPQVEDRVNRKRVRLSMSRWRTDTHRDGFLAAKYLVRSLRGLSRKIPSQQFAHLDGVYRKVAYRMQAEALLVRENQFSERYADLCGAAVALAVNSNILELTRKVKFLVADEDYTLDGSPSWAARLLERATGLFREIRECWLFC